MKTAIIKTIILTICVILGIIFEGYVYTMLWHWGVVPLGFKDITIAHALLLSTIYSALRVLFGDKNVPDEEDAKKGAEFLILKRFVMFAFLLGFGYIFHYLMSIGF